MSENPLITPEMMPALQGFIPAALATASDAGIPNINTISQVHYVDENHVALSWQFFNKTWNNLQENPNLAVVATCPQSLDMYRFGLYFESHTDEGPLFDQMSMMLDAIATMQGREGVFKLAAVVLCRVVSVEKFYDANS